ncbi:sigma-54-dependent Fis family transcriptional regulator [candidate division KSB1 bacterium]|nr:sigma-54-dependent Fis family transcriptional regulator [candidate division KSB1 bacterium]
MPHYTILIVDDEAAQREVLAGFLKKKGYSVRASETGEKALHVLRNETVDLVLSDMRMPEMDGAELLRRIKSLNPQIDVIVMTAFGSIETATETMKNGATDFITKPVDLQQLELTVQKILTKKQLILENERLRELLNDRFSFDGIISNSGAMAEALSVAGRVAPSKATVLITGESGTGKELIAKAIHMSSPRADKPFIAVNMAALSENLVESELFGHEKGAFTGAHQQRKGRFELADSGSLFIDEVGDIPAGTQVKLLRVLQEQQIERIGSSQAIPIDVRVIAATNRPLEKMVEDGTFRQDLYYRLNVVKITLPPLRDRKTDIPLLTDFFIRKYAKLNEKTITGFSREAMDRLFKHDFPGNVRELENIVEQAVVLARDDIITVAELPVTLTGQHDSPESGISGRTFADKVEIFEKKLIYDALEAAGGVQTKAAELLGMSERHLRYKLQKYGKNKEKNL